MATSRVDSSNKVRSCGQGEGRTYLFPSTLDNMASLCMALRSGTRLEVWMYMVWKGEEDTLGDSER
jgi:hypothetical protein